MAVVWVWSGFQKSLRRKPAEGMDELLFQEQRLLVGFLLMGHVAQLDRLGFIIVGGLCRVGFQLL